MVRESAKTLRANFCEGKKHKDINSSNSATHLVIFHLGSPRHHGAFFSAFGFPISTIQLSKFIEQAQCLWMSTWRKHKQLAHYNRPESQRDGDKAHTQGSSNIVPSAYQLWNLQACFSSGFQVDKLNTHPHIKLSVFSEVSCGALMKHLH